jgi:hypothetical protein
VVDTINADGTISPDTVSIDAICNVGGMPIQPSWSLEQSDRAMIGVDGTVRIFSGIAGDLDITARSQVLTARDTAVVHVVVDVAAQTGMADPNLFDAASATADPGKTLYPYRETVFPLDLKAPLVQWQTGGTPASQVQISLRYPAGSAAPTFSYVHTIAGEPTDGTLETTGAPAWQIPQPVWSAFDRTAAGGAGEIVIQRYAGATLYNAMTIPVTFATEALRGTVYYTQYLRRVLKPGAQLLCNEEVEQPDLPENYNALAPGGTICPVGNCTHADEVFGGSTTRAIDMSNPAANNLDPFNNTGGCPVCHSVSAQGNVYVAGSRYLQTWGTPAGSSTGFVNTITASATGTAEFATVGEAGNYFRYRTETDWDSRGFSYAPLTPNGALALQGYYFWGNTRDSNVTSNDTTAMGLMDGSQQSAMFFVPTANPGPSVLYATTAPLSATLNTATNELTATSAGVLPIIDGMTLAANDSLLVKDQADPIQNGIYVVTNLGSAPTAGGLITSSTTLAVTASSTISPNAASNAFDNDPNSRWESEWSDPQWLQVDLGSVQTVSGIRIDWETESGRTYYLETSLDGTTWTTVSNSDNPVSGQHRIDDHTFAATAARYVRMVATARPTSYGYSIWEMDVYGSAGGTPYKLTRRRDARTPATADGSLKAGSEVRVRRGTANYGHVFRLTAPATTPQVNVDELIFEDVNATPLTWPMMASTISPDGTKLAYVTGDTDPIGTDTTAWRKGISMMDFDQDTRTLTNKKRIINNAGAAGSQNTLKWPFFEHDSRSLIVQESNSSNYCNTENPSSDVGKACRHSRYGHMAPTNRGLWPGILHSVDTAAADPASTKAELSRLNDAEDPADADKAYQPTVLPFESGGYRWVVFTSPRSYGNQVNQVGTHFTCGATMLWVAAMDDEPASATDRSHPAFFLPGQNVARIRGQDATTPEHFVNERGYLVPSPCKPNDTPCTTSDECCTDNCAVSSVPESGPPTRVCKDEDACSETGGACLSNSDCCGGSPCVASKCQVEPSYATPSTFRRVFEAECPSGFHPLWGLFIYHLTTPDTSHIAFSAVTAATEMELETADTVALKDSSGDNLGLPVEAVDVGERLLADDVSAALPFLRVHMTLHPSNDGLVAPVLHDWEQRYTCVPGE